MVPQHARAATPNFVYMCTFAAAHHNPTAQQAVAQLPCGHVTVLLDKLNDHPQRDWYATTAVEYDWSRNVLTHHIATGLHGRVSAAPSNFTAQLPAADRELDHQLTRDPCVLDFLDLTQPTAERELESALVDRRQTFLLELGHGFRVHRPAVPLPGPRRRLLP